MGASVRATKRPLPECSGGPLWTVSSWDGSAGGVIRTVSTLDNVVRCGGFPPHEPGPRSDEAVTFVNPGSGWAGGQVITPPHMSKRPSYPDLPARGERARRNNTEARHRNFALKRRIDKSALAHLRKEGFSPQS